jgi:hypothetical protein
MSESDFQQTLGYHLKHIHMYMNNQEYIQSMTLYSQLSCFAYMQLLLDGYKIVNTASTQQAKHCTSRNNITWLAASRHSVEADYEHTSAAITPLLRITYSGPDTGENEVRCNHLTMAKI